MKPLVQQALIGTAKQATAPPSDHPAATLVAQASTGSVEQQLLLAAGAMAVWERAGVLSAVAPPLPEPAAVETLAICSPQMASLVADLLRQAASEPSILIEALELVCAAKQVLPPALLPAALNLPNRRELRAVVPGVLGERGRWLAQFNPDWRWARHFVADADQAGLPENAETVWQEGDLAARAGLLKLARRYDRPRSRQWLAEAWSVEKADARSQLLAAFAGQLSADDLPTLEPILKDRSAALRRQAAQALAQIDHSPLAERMCARADGMIRFASPPKPAGLGGKLKSLLGAPVMGKLEITLPQELPKDWIADGIEAKPPQGVGERAFWLIQVVSLVSPRHWQTASGLSPIDIVALAAAAEHGEALLAGLTQAAIAAQEADWLAALWDHGLAAAAATRSQKLAPERLETLRSILVALPATQAEPRLIQLLGGNASLSLLNVSAAIGSLPRPWSESFARQYLKWFLGAAGRPEDYHLWSTSSPVAAVSIPPSCFAEALREAPQAILKEDGPAWLKQFDTFQESVRLRKRLREA